MQITNLFLYKFVFMIALLVAETGFLYRLKKRSNYALRMVLTNFGGLLFVLIFPISSYNAVFSSLMFSVFFVLTIFMAKLCYEISWRSCIFCTVAGYSIQHLASVLYDLVITLSGFEQTAQIYSDSTTKPSALMVLIFVEVYVLVYWVLLRYFGSKINEEENITIKSNSLMGLVVLTVLVEIVLNAFVIYRKYESFDTVYYMVATITNIFCSIAVLTIQFGLVLQKTLEDELSIVYHMWHQEQKQFHLTKRTIDLVNMKCHDMKHQIHAIGTTEAISPAALKEIEDTISIYDSIVKTGNQALDIILAEKSLYCQKQGIFISCMIDGEKLNFMSDTDIYSLFGNLIDNAIQTVAELEQDKRVIGITIKAEGALLSVNSHNYFQGELQVESGRPIPRNKDRDYHGFGFKSMTMIVEKYNGTLSFEAKNQIFNLNILFPLPAKVAADG